MRASEFISEAKKKAVKTRLDPQCWKGKKIGNPKTKVKGGVRVNNCVPVEEGFLDYFKKKPNIAQRRKKWLELWQEEYKDQSYRFGDPQRAFSAFSEKLEEIIKKEFPVYSEKVIGRLARKEAEIALRTDNPQWDGWGLGPQSATSELAPGERGFKKPEPRKFRDREIPPANPNQMNLDLD